MAKVFGEKSRYAFPVGALPSLHAAWPFLLLRVLLAASPAGGASLLVAYALAMAFTLVYTADHFVFDILLGWTYVIVVFLAFRCLGTCVLALSAGHYAAIGARQFGDADVRRR